MFFILNNDNNQFVRAEYPEQVSKYIASFKENGGDPDDIEIINIDLDSVMTVDEFDDLWL
jgi:hypothetical protein